MIFKGVMEYSNANRIKHSCSFTPQKIRLSLGAALGWVHNMAVVGVRDIRAHDRSGKSELFSGVTIVAVVVAIRGFNVVADTFQNIR